MGQKVNPVGLRLNVNNPFSGKRFNDTDVVYLDKNRMFQIKFEKMEWIKIFKYGN